MLTNMSTCEFLPPRDIDAGQELQIDPNGVALTEPRAVTEGFLLLLWSNKRSRSGPIYRPSNKARMRKPISCCPFGQIILRSPHASS